MRKRGREVGESGGEVEEDNNLRAAKQQKMDSLQAQMAHMLEGMAELKKNVATKDDISCLLYTSPSPRDRQKSRMPSSA